MKFEGSPGAYASLIRRMLIYVTENPDAKDTLEGINQFWLSPRRIPYGTDEVQAVLDFLVETKGWLTKSSKAAASVTLYGLNKERLDEIRWFLQQSGKGD